MAERRRKVHPFIQETIDLIRSACVAVTRYKEQEEAIVARCISAELEYHDVYDMTEGQLGDALAVGAGFSRVLLKSAREVANRRTEGDMGYSCQMCPMKYPFAERLRRHEVMSKHQPYVSGPRVKQEALVALDEEVEEEVVVDSDHDTIHDQQL